MNIDVAAGIATKGIQEKLPGGVVRYRKINHGQALKVSVVSGKTAVHEVVDLPTWDARIIEVVEDLVWRIVPRRSAWERLGEMDL